MEIEQLEQIAAVIVTAGLVAGNFLMFTPWRNGEDPRQRQPESRIPQEKTIQRAGNDMMRIRFNRFKVNELSENLSLIHI